jgi:hypothetical protein
MTGIVFPGQQTVSVRAGRVSGRALARHFMSDTPTAGLHDPSHGDTHELF